MCFRRVVDCVCVRVPKLNCEHLEESGTLVLDPE